MAKKKKSEVYDPFAHFGLMRKKFFEDFWEPMEFPQIKFPEARSPLVNVQSRGKNIVVTAELPGVSKEDLSVDAEEDFIKIEAEMKKESEKEKKDFYRYERKYSSFSRVVPMPEKIVPSKVKGELKNGVLELTAPKLKAPKPKKTKKVKIK